MAKRRRKRTRRAKKQAEYPGWVWMFFGLALGLSVAVAIYVKDRTPVSVARAAPSTPASMQDAIDNNGETASQAAIVAPPPKPRFDFYELLPLSNVEIDDEPHVSDSNIEPVAIEKPGVYQLQAGAFSTHADADRRRAELALHGIESEIVPAQVNGRTYHRVVIGPINDLDELNLTRSRLRVAKIDVLRYRIGD